MEKVFITGASGFVGTHLMNHLKNQGYHVEGISRSGKNSDGVQICDALNHEKLTEILLEFNPDYIFHLASEKERNTSDPTIIFQFMENSFQMSKSILQASLLLKSLKKFIFIGSCDEYGNGRAPYTETQRENPSSPYAMSKTFFISMLQMLFKTQKFPFVALRPSVVYGPGQKEDMFLPALLKSLVSGKEFPMSPGEQIRDFLYIDDLVMACMKVIHAGSLSGEIINIASGRSYKILELAVKAADLIGGNSRKLLKPGTLSYRVNEIMNYSVNISKAEQLLEWKPEITLDDGLRKILESVKIE